MIYICGTYFGWNLKNENKLAQIMKQNHLQETKALFQIQT